MHLREKIERREAILAVVGLGYVGLPLAMGFAEGGLEVIGFDIDGEKVNALNSGISHVSDVPSEKVSSLVGRAGQGSFRATTDFSLLQQADAVIICVPTPLNKNKEPDLSFILAVTDSIADELHPGMLISLESTTYPGTTEEVILPRLASKVVDGRRLEIGVDFFLAFSPERIDPGRVDWVVRNTPKVVGGVTPQCLEHAIALYSLAVDRPVPVSSPRVAEMVKLLENTFRAVNIGLVNELALICDRLGIDVWEVIDAAKTKPFGFQSFYPGPGLGGHCIPIDPHYLAWKLKSLNYNARFIQVAAEVNLSMPNYVLEKVTSALNDRAKSVRDSDVLVLGVAYKEDIGDLRESPALDVIGLLEEKGAKISYCDPFIPEFQHNGFRYVGVALTKDRLARADCVVITTAHSSFDWALIAETAVLVVDTRNALRNVKGSAKVVPI